MTVIFLLILLSIVIAAGFLVGFVWSVRSGQYEDTCTPSMRLLMDDSSGAGGSPAVTIPKPTECDSLECCPTTARPVSHSMNRAAADVSPLTYLWRSLSRLTSAATSSKVEDGTVGPPQLDSGAQGAHNVGR